MKCDCCNEIHNELFEALTDNGWKNMCHECLYWYKRSLFED